MNHGFSSRSPLVRMMAVGALALALVHAPPAAAAVKIRLATLAPKDTSLHKSLLQMGEGWRKDSGGELQLTIYTDGTMGGEADMVRRMRIGQIQAAMLTVAGLSQIEESTRALQLMPMMFRSLEELEFVQEQLRADMEKKFRDKGFEVLFWGDLGWVRFFSKQPGARVEDLRRTKMFVWSGDPRSADVMRSAGINAVPLEQTDVLTGLQTGLIDSVPSVPIYALAGQFFNPAPHMLEVNWVPLVGATVVLKKSWDAIPAGQRAAVLKTAAAAGAQIRQRSRVESDEAVAAMEKRGLKVQRPSAGELQEWYRFADELYPRIRGSVVPAGTFDEVQRLVREYRKKQ